MNASPYKLVIFDWDGTLFDSVKQIVESLLWAASQHHITLSPDAAKHIIGLGLPEAMQTLFPSHQTLHPQIQAAYGQHYVAHAHTQGWFAGVDDLLTLLRLAKIVQDLIVF
jgi:phosphoglycolate phosphatase